MSSPKSEDSPANEPSKAQKRNIRTHTPRPDELSCEALEFITAVDDYKRRHMRSFLEDEEVIEIILELGYRMEKEGADITDHQLAAYADARLRYRDSDGRLFPTWSEVFKLLGEVGYERTNSAA